MVEQLDTAVRLGSSTAPEIAVQLTKGSHVENPLHKESIVHFAPSALMPLDNGSDEGYGPDVDAEEPAKATVAASAHAKMRLIQKINVARERLVHSLFGQGTSDWLGGMLSCKEWMAIMISMTVFCLYARDIVNAAAGRNDADIVISAMLLACFSVFSMEIILASLFVDSYFGSFFFWIDVVGTVSLIFDIRWLGQGLLGNDRSSNVVQITRAGRAARVGSQIGRITRLLRVVKALRASRMMRMWQIRSRKRVGAHSSAFKESREDFKAQQLRPTVLGELLAEATTRKCVVVIIFILIVATFLQSGVPVVDEDTRVALVTHGVMSTDEFIAASNYPVVYMRVVTLAAQGATTVVPFTRDELQSSQVFKTDADCILYPEHGTGAVPCGFEDNVSEVWYDITRLQQENAGLNIALTTVVLIALMASAFFFGKDANTYVIVPIDTMLLYLKRVMTMGHAMANDALEKHSAVSDDANLPETSVLATYVMKLVNDIDMARQKAEEERQISDTLLHSMVPGHIAGRLKELRWWEGFESVGDTTIADSYKSVTVLFTDIVGFTTLSSRISPEEAMRHLNHMYTVFDQITEKYGLYKVETIGDSYMLVGGAPDARPDHAELVAAAALEIKESVPLLQEISGEKEINVRIGMHTGAVTAGVVGFKNPRWHLFGDTCNTASRMESTGLAGEVQLSADTYALIKDSFVCNVRGKIAVKGKGEMVTYTLLKRRTLSLARTSASLGLFSDDSGNRLSAGERKPAASATMSREELLRSPQYKKALERYTAARNSLLSEEEQLVKLLKSTEPVSPASAAHSDQTGPLLLAGIGISAAAGAPGGAAAAASAAAAAPAAPASSISSPSAKSTAAAAAAAAPVILLPSVAAKLEKEDFKRLVSDTAMVRDVELRQLAAHLHEELAESKALIAQYAADKLGTRRRDGIMSLYQRYVDNPTMPLKDLLTQVVDLLYKSVECDVIKLYIVDHIRQQLWPASRGHVNDIQRAIPLRGTLAGAAVKERQAIRVADCRHGSAFNAELEELPGYQSKSVMAVPVFGQDTDKDAVIAVVVAINRWTGWDEAGMDDTERSITEFSDNDEAAMKESADCVSTLLVRRRSELLLTASSLAPAGAFATSLPRNVVVQRLRGISRRSNLALCDVGGSNLWGARSDELLGYARDLLGGFTGLLHRLGASHEALLGFLVRLAAEHAPRPYYNMAHAVNTLQGLYATHVVLDLVDLLGDHACAALLLAALTRNLYAPEQDGGAADEGAAVAGPAATDRTSNGSIPEAGASHYSRSSVTLQPPPGDADRRSARRSYTSMGRAASRGNASGGGAGGGPGPRGALKYAYTVAVRSFEQAQAQQLQTRLSGSGVATRPSEGGVAAAAAAAVAQQAASAGSFTAASAPAAATGPAAASAPGDAGAAQQQPAPAAARKGANARAFAARLDHVLSKDGNLLGGLDAAAAAAIKESVVELVSGCSTPLATLMASPLLSHRVCADELLLMLNAGADGRAAGVKLISLVLLQAWSEAVHVKRYEVSLKLLTLRASESGAVTTSSASQQPAPMLQPPMLAAVAGGAPPKAAAAPMLQQTRSSRPMLSLLSKRWMNFSSGSKESAAAAAELPVAVGRKASVAARRFSATLPSTPAMWGFGEAGGEEAHVAALAGAAAGAAAAGGAASAPTTPAGDGGMQAAVPGGSRTQASVVQLLLREVSRMQVEVIPLWQRAAELFPQLASFSEAQVQAKAQYLAIIQGSDPSTGSSTPTSPATATGVRITLPPSRSLGRSTSRQRDSANWLRRAASGKEYTNGGQGDATDDARYVAAEDEEEWDALERSPPRRPALTRHASFTSGIIPLPAIMAAVAAVDANGGKGQGLQGRYSLGSVPVPAAQELSQQQQQAAGGGVPPAAGQQQLHQRPALRTRLSKDSTALAAAGAAGAPSGNPTPRGSSSQAALPALPTSNSPRSSASSAAYLQAHPVISQTPSPTAPPAALSLPVQHVPYRVTLGGGGLPSSCGFILVPAAAQQQQQQQQPPGSERTSRSSLARLTPFMSFAAPAPTTDAAQPGRASGSGSAGSAPAAAAAPPDELLPMPPASASMNSPRSQHRAPARLFIDVEDGAVAAVAASQAGGAPLPPVDAAATVLSALPRLLLTKDAQPLLARDSGLSAVFEGVLEGVDTPGAGSSAGNALGISGTSPAGPSSFAGTGVGGFTSPLGKPPAHQPPSRTNHTDDGDDVQVGSRQRAEHGP